MTLVTFIDVVLALVALEAVVLCVIGPRYWPRVSRLSLLAMLAAGAVLMLALRAVARGASLGEMMAWLALALVAHLVDLRFRLRA